MSEIPLYRWWCLLVSRETWHHQELLDSASSVLKILYGQGRAGHSAGSASFGDRSKDCPKLILQERETQNSLGEGTGG